MTGVIKLFKKDQPVGFEKDGLIREGVIVEVTEDGTFAACIFDGVLIGTETKYLKSLEVLYDEYAAEMEAKNPPCAIHDAIGCPFCNAWVKA